MILPALNQSQCYYQSCVTISVSISVSVSVPSRMTVRVINIFHYYHLCYLYCHMSNITHMTVLQCPILYDSLLIYSTALILLEVYSALAAANTSSFCF